MRIRAARATDADGAAAVMRRSITDLCRADHHDDPATLARWLENKTGADVKAWLKEPERYAASAISADDVLVGFGLITRAGEILLLYVDPDAAGQGAGVALLRDLERQARAWGLDRIYLDSTRTARDFYARHAYTGSDEARRRADGLSCLAMEKTLRP